MYPAVTLCYKNGDGIGFKENILQVVAIFLKLSKSLTSQAFNLTGYWKNSAGGFFVLSRTIELFPGDYNNNTWINFGWGHQSLSELWNRATYDVRTRVKPTLERPMYFILCGRGKGKVKSCIEICSTQHSIKGLLLAFLQTWSSLYISLALSNISI